jgi:hypothetical protein
MPLIRDYNDDSNIYGLKGHSTLMSVCKFRSFMKRNLRSFHTNSFSRKLLLPTRPSATKHSPNSAITNETPVPPPQVRTTPLDGGAAEQRKTDDDAPSPAPAAATTTTSAPGSRTAAAMTSGRMLLPGSPRPCPNS